MVWEEGGGVVWEEGGGAVWEEGGGGGRTRWEGGRGGGRFVEVRALNTCSCVHVHCTTCVWTHRA